MSLAKIFIIIQVLVGVLFVAAVLLQSRGTGLGETFGGSGVFYGNRRGPEKTLYLITIGLAV
ncbi:TPA: preprotein translocase subunit SecG, partial [Patescibacteria group bacterium]|nr:preprotein translocase subunit SecG [Patescibacteria group bacterium]